MKEKLIYASFVVNIISVLTIFIVMPVFAYLAPEFWKILFSGLGRYVFFSILGFLFLISTFHWLYCFFIQIQNDIYSKHIIPLFFLNIFYAPVYYYLVKIKKIPLHNEIKKKEETEVELTESDYIALTRRSIFETLYLWTSKEEQIKFQISSPNAQVSDELFCQWTDFYNPEFDGFETSFSKAELELLNEFNELFIIISKNTPQQLPHITEFVKMKEWKTLNRKAKEILDKINTATNSTYMSCGGSERL